MEKYNRKNEHHSSNKRDNGQGSDRNTDWEKRPSPWQNEWQLRQSLLKLSGTTGNLKKKKTKATQPEVSATQPEVISTQPEVITVTDSDSDDSYTPALVQTAATATIVKAGPSGEPATTASTVLCESLGPRYHIKLKNQLYSPNHLRYIQK